jgi:hypothetical protein
MVAAAGIRLLAETRLDRRDLLIIAVAVGVGQGMAAVPDLVAIAPEQLRVLLITGIVPAGFLAVLLNVVLPGRDTGTESPLGATVAPAAVDTDGRPYSQPPRREIAGDRPSHDDPPHDAAPPPR